MNEKKIKHLEMIENVIDRLAGNSFHLKGWAVALVSLIGALIVNGSRISFICIDLIPILSFWILDSYYFSLERKYQVLYKSVAKKAEADIDFLMDARSIVLEEDEKNRCSLFSCMFSMTELCFYGFILVAALAVVIVSRMLG